MVTIIASTSSSLVVAMVIGWVLKYSDYLCYNLHTTGVHVDSNKTTF